MRKCAKCKETKELKEMAGKGYWCKACHSEYRKERYRTHSKAKELAQCHVYYAKNRQKMLKYQKQYSLDNREYKTFYEYCRQNFNKIK